MIFLENLKTVNFLKCENLKTVNFFKCKNFKTVEIFVKNLKIL